MKLLQVLDKSLENEGKLNDDVPKLNAFAGTLFLRHVCPALVAVRTNSVSNQALQQESAVAVFLTAFIQAAANQAGAGKLAAGMSAECQDLVQKALEDCAGPLKAFKQAVMDRQIEA